MKVGETITVDRRALNNYAGVFYFSHDVMLCFAALLTGANRGMIWHTANQAAVHLSSMGFAGTALAKQLEQIKAECDPAIAADLSEDRRFELAAEVFRLSRAVGQILEHVAKMPG